MLITVFCYCKSTQELHFFYAKILLFDRYELLDIKQASSFNVQNAANNVYYVYIF